MPELIAVHNISFGKKGERQTIKAGDRFELNEFKDHFSESEFQEMMKNGNIAAPEQMSYATPAIMRAQQRAAANEVVTEHRSPRTDTGTGRTAEAVGGITRPIVVDNDDDDDEEDSQPRRRGGRRKKVKSDDDNDEV